LTASGTRAPSSVGAIHMMRQIAGGVCFLKAKPAASTRGQGSGRMGPPQQRDETRESLAKHGAANLYVPAYQRQCVYEISGLLMIASVMGGVAEAAQRDQLARHGGHGRAIQSGVCTSATLLLLLMSPLLRQRRTLQVGAGNENRLARTARQRDSRLRCDWHQDGHGSRRSALAEHGRGAQGALRLNIRRHE
jgi:hypothetical protein